MAAKKTIKLLGEPIQNEDDKAAEAIVPGMLVNYNGSGDLIKHAGAGLNAAAAFALEREEMGKDIDVAYAIGDAVKVGVFAPGCRVNALVATAAPAIVKGDMLESAGNGTLRKAVANAAVADTTRKGTIARALEALTNVSGVNQRLRIEII
jgi:hypothetical protein